MEGPKAQRPSSATGVDLALAPVVLEQAPVVTVSCGHRRPPPLGDRLRAWKRGFFCHIVVALSRPQR